MYEVYIKVKKFVLGRWGNEISESDVIRMLILSLYLV